MLVLRMDFGKESTACDLCVMLICMCVLTNDNFCINLDTNEQCPLLQHHKSSSEHFLSQDSTRLRRLFDRGRPTSSEFRNALLEWSPEGRPSVKMRLIMLASLLL